MNSKILPPLIVFATLAGSVSVSRAALNFAALGYLDPQGTRESIQTRVSDDGKSAAGMGVGKGGGAEGFYWTAQSGMSGIGTLSKEAIIGSEALDISGNGAAVVGYSYTSNGSQVAVRWTPGGGMTSLGDLPGGPVESTAYGISADGNTVVGIGRTGTTTYRGFRWTAAGGMTALALLSGETYNYAYAISGDGKVIGGVTGHGAPPTEQNQAVLWTPSAILGLGDLPGGAVFARTLALSWDGSAAVGQSASANGSEGFLWTAQSHTMRGLGDLPGGGFDSQALSISGDGTRVVGYGTTAAGKEAFVWEESTGMKRLADVLAENGLIPNGWKLEEATDISTDGDTIAGWGRTLDGGFQAFLVSGFNTVPEPSAAGLILIVGGGILISRQRRRPA